MDPCLGKCQCTIMDTKLSCSKVYYILNIMFFLCVTYFNFNFAMLLPLLKIDTGRGCM